MAQDDLRHDAPDEKQALVLELFAQDVQVGLDAAVAEKRQTLVRLIEGLWDKYFSSMDTIIQQREAVATQLTRALKGLGYVS